MKSLRKMFVCVLLLAVFACSCNMNTSPAKKVDGTPDDSSSSATSLLTADKNSSFSESSDADNGSSKAASSKNGTSSKNKTSSKDKVNSKTPASSEQASSSVQSEEKSNSDISSNQPTSSVEVSSEKPSDGKIKYVAFTFDDGPHSTYTKKIVNKFSEYGGACTFFVVGNRIGSNNGAAIQYAVNNGCEIGIHAYTHEYKYDRCTDAQFNSELSKTADAIHKYLPDYDITLMRPVGGMITSSRVASCEYSVINWNIDSNDWRYKNNSKSSAVNKIRNNIMKNVGSGDIILMHEIYGNSYSALCEVLDEMYDDGYRFVTVTELIGKGNLQPGKKYTHG